MELPFKEIKTDRLILNMMKLSDARSVLEIRSNPIVIKYLGQDPMPSIDAAVTWIKNGLSDLELKKGINWAIRDPNSLKLIGLIGFWKLMETKNRAEIGYSLHPEYHRKGLMSEAITAVLDYGFDELKLHSIQAEIDPLNEASQAVLEKMKFRKEAHFTEDYLYRGIYTDSAIYSLLERWYRNQKR
ncbi:GNAT family N-acetyltransferase [Saprospiraceae bacterium]|nr:GNAT family N-acetyltransferase [Saprospiraceae bacterium]